MKKTLLHPFLFAVYPILLLFSINVDRVPLYETGRTVFYSLLATCLLLGLLRLLFGNWYRAGLTTSLAMLLFSSYGHVYNLMVGKTIAGVVGRADYLASLWMTIFILVGWWFLRKLANPLDLTYFANIIALALIVMPFWQIGQFAIKQSQSRRLDHLQNLPVAVLDHTTRPPDIYYIILDEYGRSDVLQEVMNYDNSGFIERLKEKGFYVAEQSYANYGLTLHSLSSSLNYEYLDNETSPDPAANSTNVYRQIELARTNRVRVLLEKAGYEFVTFTTGYVFTEFHDADQYIEPAGYLNSFEVEYINSSALIVMRVALVEVRTRSIILNAFDKIKQIPQHNPDQPKFVFMHIPAAHAPFVFGPNGESSSFWTFPEVMGEEKTKGYVNAYRNQVTYINKQVEEAVDTILAKSPVPPIIIVQGDHGSQSLLDWWSIKNSCVKERMSILNAYYLPGPQASQLYPTITPVNTFRVVLDGYFGTHLGRIEDRSYFWDRMELFNYIDVTDRMPDCVLP